MARIVPRQVRDTLARSVARSHLAKAEARASRMEEALANERSEVSRLRDERDKALRALEDARSRIQVLECSMARRPIATERFASESCLCCEASNLTAAPYPYTRDPRFADLVVLSCMNCGISWVPELPFSLDEYYASAYATENRKDRGLDPDSYFRSLEEDPSRSRYLRRARRQARYVESLIPQAQRILDYGSGPGYFLRCIEADGRDLFAVEPDDHSHKYLSYLNAYLVEDLRRVEHTIDFLLASHSLEHLPAGECSARLVDFANTLSTRGIACVEVPVGTLLRHELVSRHAPHTIFFSPEALELMMRSAGFETVVLGSPAREQSPVMKDPLYVPQSHLDIDGRGPIVALGSVLQNDVRLLEFGLYD